METKKYNKSANMTNKQKFPREFREGIRNFVVSYMITEPSNLIDFAVQYFSKDVEMRNLTPGREEEKEKTLPKLKRLSDASIMSVREISTTGHRQGVSSEIYNPEEPDPDEKEHHKIHRKTEAQTNYLISTVKKVFAFRIMDHNILNTIVEHMHHHKVKKGEHIMREGFNAERFFIIERGTFTEHASKHKSSKNKDLKRESKTMIDTGHFGQLALHYHHIIPNTVMAESDGELWYIERQVFRHLLLKHSYEKTKQFSDICDEIVLLNELSEDAKMDLYDAFEQKEFPTQTEIYVEGEEPKGMYFLQFGNVKLYSIDKKGEEINVKYYLKGEYFGEIEILENKKRESNAVAVGIVKVAFLPVECFDRVLGKSRGRMEENTKMVEYEHKVEYLHGVPNLVLEAGQIKEVKRV